MWNFNFESENILRLYAKGNKDGMMTAFEREKKLLSPEQRKEYEAALAVIKAKYAAQVDMTVNWTRNEQQKFARVLKSKHWKANFETALSDEVNREIEESRAQEKKAIDTKRAMELPFPEEEDWWKDIPWVAEWKADLRFTNGEGDYRKETVTVSYTEAKKKTRIIWKGKGRKKITEEVKVKKTAKIHLVHDIGLTFYTVEKGDTLETIRQKLSAIPSFGYVKELRRKLDGMNIWARQLKPGLLVPIPWEWWDRQLTDRQFANQCTLAINELISHPIYGERCQNLLKQLPKNMLVSLMVATAKQESGGKPLWQMEFHRWEKAYSSYSFSIFHVLMDGAGLLARQRLGLTEWQLYHPKNAAKLYIAFILEKASSNKFWPAWEGAKANIRERGKFEDFARFYNGTYWKKTNPNYTKHMEKYFHDAAEMFLTQQRLAQSAPPKTKKNWLQSLFSDS